MKRSGEPHSMSGSFASCLLLFLSFSTVLVFTIVGIDFPDSEDIVGGQELVDEIIAKNRD